MKVIHNGMVQDCVYRFSRINAKSHNNISSPISTDFNTKFKWIHCDVLYLLNHPFQSTPNAIVLEYNYYELIESMGTVTTD